MPLRVRSVFGSYDLFAKTIPGIIFFMGILSLLPELPSLPGETGSVSLVTIAIVSTLVFGFMVGQALHSIAVAIEGFLYSIGKRIYDWQPFLRRETWIDREGAIQRISESSDRPKIVLAISAPLRIPLSILIEIYCWSVSHIYGLLVPHRLWFKRKLEKEFVSKNEPDPLYDWFKIQCRDHLRNFELDLPKRHQDVYRFVMSYLEFVGSGRARQFQATASFCRSMWITFGFYSILYAILVWFGSEKIFGFPSNIQGLLNEYPSIIVASLAISSVLFMYSTIQYKKHFIEYIVVDFYTVHQMDVLDQPDN